MTEAARCVSCGNTFYREDYFWNITYECSSCQQTKRFSQLAEQSRIENEFYHRQNLAASLQNASATMLKVQAELETQKAIERQTQAILESKIDTQEAYEAGYNYLDHEYLYDDNPRNLDVFADENGSIMHGSDGGPYITPNLSKHWVRGVSDRIAEIPDADYEFIKQQAYQAGRQSVDGTLSSDFYLTTQRYLDEDDTDTEITTYTFSSNHKRIMDENTGEIRFFYDSPFSTQELNDLFTQGVNDAYTELNTEEQKKHRLENEIAEIKRQVQQELEENNKRELENKKAKRKSLMYYIVAWVFPFIALPIIWATTYSWICFFMTFILVPAISIHYIKKSEAYNT